LWKNPSPNNSENFLKKYLHHFEMKFSEISPKIFFVFFWELEESDCIIKFSVKLSVRRDDPMRGRDLIEIVHFFLTLLGKKTFSRCPVMGGASAFARSKDLGKN